MNVGGSSMCGVCGSRSRGSSSSVAVQHVVYVDQHGKVLAQHTAPMVLLSLAFLPNTRAEGIGMVWSKCCCHQGHAAIKNSLQQISLVDILGAG